MSKQLSLYTLNVRQLFDDSENIKLWIPVFVPIQFSNY